MENLLSALNEAGSWLQMISLLAGIVYIVMQIFQHRLMWYFNLVTAGAALLVAISNTNKGEWAPIWAQTLLNVYFIVMSIIGIARWKKLSEQTGGIHIVRLGRKKAIVTAAIIIVGAPLACFLFSLTSDPAPVLDGVSFVLSLLAAWYLACSHLEQWFLWMAANTMVVSVYASQEKWGMMALYCCYLISCVIGFFHWRRTGVRVEG